VTVTVRPQEHGVGCDGDPVSILDLFRSLRPKWMRRAECTNPGYDPVWWQTDDPEGNALAKQVCAGCPVRAECLEHGNVNREIGVWGGLDEQERRAYLDAWASIGA